MERKKLYLGAIILAAIIAVGLIKHDSLIGLLKSKTVPSTTVYGACYTADGACTEVFSADCPKNNTFSSNFMVPNGRCPSGENMLVKGMGVVANCDGPDNTVKISMAKKDCTADLKETLARWERSCPAGTVAQQYVGATNTGSYVNNDQPPSCVAHCSAVITCVPEETRPPNLSVPPADIRGTPRPRY